jgi:hypothetical protein
MKGDFSRFTFDRKKNYNSVYMQQGRVQLDADWNELVDINAHYNETLVCDVVGPCGMPALHPGFEITAGGGLEFDGINDFIYAGKKPDLSFALKKSFTIEAWIQPHRDGSGGIAAGRFFSNDKINLKEYFLRVNPDHTLSFQWIEYLENTQKATAAVNQFKLEIKPGEFKDVVSRELSTIHTIPFGEFSFVTVTVDQNQVSIYINAEIAADCETGNFAPILNGQFLIGAGVYNKNHIYHAFKGIMEEMDIWEKTLPPARIKENMRRGLTGKEHGLIRLWRFNQGHGDRVPDLSGHSEPCILGNGNQDNMPQWLAPGIRIGKGRCYNHGVLCENEQEIPFSQQPGYPGAIEPHGFHRSNDFLFYLDTWDRFITAVEDPDIREVALGGPDTAARTQTVWQVKWVPESEEKLFFRILESSGQLKARHNPERILHDNRLYRVEIHNPGGMINAPASQAFYPVLEVEPVDSSPNQVSIKSWQGGSDQWQPGQYVKFIGHENGTANQSPPVMITEIDHKSGLLTLEALPVEAAAGNIFRLFPIATFKWSRENGTVVFPIKSLENRTLILDDPYGYGSSLNKGDWVEVVDDDYVLEGRAAHLCCIRDIEATPRGNLMITLQPPPPRDVGKDPDKHPLVRLWSQKDKRFKEDNLENRENEQLLTGGVIPVWGGQWIELEEGIQVYFDGGGIYHHGDYWWIPARSADNEIQWPCDNHEPVSLPPHGIKHHYAPLAVVEHRHHQFFVKKDLRHIFPPLISQHYKTSFNHQPNAGLPDKEASIEPYE